LRIHLGMDGAIPDPFKTVYDLERFVTTVPYENMSVVTRFMVNRAHRHTQVSFQLIHANSEFHLLQGIQLGFIACSPHLLNLYLALGFRTFTKNYSDAEVGFVVPMAYVVRDLVYLESIASPLSGLTAKYVTPAEIPPWVDSVLPTHSSVRSERFDQGQYWSDLYGLLTEKSQGKYYIFDGLSDDQIKLLLGKGHVIQCRNGELVVRKGTVSHGIFLLLSGVLEVRDDHRAINVLGRGEVFGELGFLLDSPRTANVYAVGDDVRILSLDDQTLRGLMTTDALTSAQFLLNLSKVLCLRLVQVQSRFSFD